MLRILTFVYKHHTKVLPINYQFFFKPNTMPYGHRHPLALNIQLSRTNLKRYSPSCLGPHIWNILPIKIKMLPYLGSFVSSSKAYLIDNNITDISKLKGIYY